MRAVLQSAFTVTTGLGNLLVVLMEATLSEVLEKVSNFQIQLYKLWNVSNLFFAGGISLFVCWIDVCRHVTFGLDGISLQIRGLHNCREKEIRLQIDSFWAVVIFRDYFLMTKISKI